MSERAPSPTTTTRERLSQFREKAAEKIGRFVAGTVFDRDTAVAPGERLSELRGRVSEKIGTFTARSLSRTQDHYDEEEEQRSDDEVDYGLQNIDRPLDTLVTDTTEILGSGKVDKLTKKIEKAEAKQDEPGKREGYLKYRNERIDIKIAKRTKKLDKRSRFEWINLRRRHKLEDLQYKKKVVARQSGKLEKTRREKPEEIRKEIDKLVQKKIDRKYWMELQKRKFKEHKFKHFKRTEFVANMKPEEKQAIYREAVLQIRKKNIAKGRINDGYELGAHK